MRMINEIKSLLKYIFCTLCNQAPINEALSVEYKNWENISKLCDIPIKIYGMLNIARYDIIQNNFTEIWADKDCNNV